MNKLEFNELEDLLVKNFTLNIDDIKCNKDFQSLGLDSLLSMQLSALIEEYYKIRIINDNIEYLRNPFSLYNYIIDEKCKQSKINGDYPLYKVNEFTTFNDFIKYIGNIYSKNIAFKFLENNIIQNITYADFVKDVKILALDLRKHNFINNKIGIYYENGYDWLVLYFGIITSGNYAIPISDSILNYKDNELKAIIYSSNKVINTEEIKSLNITFILGSDLLNKNSVYDDIDYLFNQIQNEPNKLAMIINTSGTGGVSKRVMLSHQNIVSDATSAANALFFCGITFNTLPLEHMFAITGSIFMPLLHGQCIYLSKGNMLLLDEVNLIQPNALITVPFSLEKLLHELKQKIEGNENKNWLSNIKERFKLNTQFDKKVVNKYLSKNLELILSGGAPLSNEIENIYGEYGIIILNGYGMTECSPGIATNRRFDHHIGCAGRKLTCCELNILSPDKTGIGELVVKGKNVMLGYENDVMNSEWIHTGDFGRIDDGYLYLCGRKKNMILLSNGENVFPEEIEKKINELKYIKEVVVRVVDDFITAEIVLVSNDNYFRKKVEDDIVKVNNTLPSYKRIRKIIVRDNDFDKTSLQKIKR